MRLKAIVQDMDKNKHLFTHMPDKDLSRKQKLDFVPVMTALLSMGGGSIASGLLEYFHFSPCTAGRRARAASDWSTAMINGRMLIKIVI